MKLDDGAETQITQWGEHGPLIVCVHGMTSSRRSWERTALQLQDRYRVVAYDQRGHGDSAGTHGPMAISRAVGDLENVVASLGEIPYALLGHSWGGTVVIEGGLRIDVDRVAAIDPALRQLSDAWYAEFIEELDVLFALHGNDRAKNIREEYAEWPEIDREGKVHAVATMTTEPIARLRDENPPASWNLLPALIDYPKPLLLAMADPAESINKQDDLVAVERDGGDNVEITVFEGEGHNLHRTGFARFMPRLETFLGGG